MILFLFHALTWVVLALIRALVLAVRIAGAVVATVLVLVGMVVLAWLVVALAAGALLMAGVELLRGHLRRRREALCTVVDIEQYLAARAGGGR